MGPVFFNNTSDMNELCIKIPKKCNKFKGPSITYSYIWHIDTAKCEFFLIRHTFCERSVKLQRLYNVYTVSIGEAMCYQMQMPLIFVIFFQTTQTKSLKNQKSPEPKIFKYRKVNKKRFEDIFQGRTIKNIVFRQCYQKFSYKRAPQKNHEIFRKLKKSVLRPAVYNPPRGITSKEKI